jgi:nicotinamide mononucleotide adenylyltransferase
MGPQLRYLIKNAFSPAEFEAEWERILAENKAEWNPYLMQLYDIREQWASAYFKDKLYPFSSTTRRSESTKSLFKHYALQKDTISSFF